jgi:hypothetical protein
MTENNALTARISTWSRSHSGRVAARMMRSVFLLDMTAPIADCGGERRSRRPVARPVPVIARASRGRAAVSLQFSVN